MGTFKICNVRKIGAKALVLLCSFFLCPVSAAQEVQEDRLSSIMLLLGIREEEQLSEQEIERFERLERNPVEINLSSASKLLSSGLFTQYQVASLIDYRDLSGDILSIEELSLVDGFGKEFAEALRPYVSLYSKSLPGYTDNPELRGTANIRTTWKPGQTVVKGKFELDYGERASVSVSATEDDLRFHAAWYGRRHLDKVVVGDFNARFGQGLVVWSGFSMSSMAAPSSLYRRPAGISASTSYSSTGLRGVAATASWKRLAFSSFASTSSFKAISDVTVGLNLSYLMKHGQISATGLYDCALSGEEDKDDLARAGIDARFCWKGVDIFAETAADFGYMSLAGIAGVVFPLGKGRAGVEGRYLPQNYEKTLTGSVRSGTYSRDEAGATLSYELGKLIFCADFYRKLSSGRDQLKLLLTHEIPFSETLALKPKLAARLRTQDERPKYEARGDFVWTNDRWSQILRLHWVHCRKNGFLGYYELGYLRERLSLYSRVTLFGADNWDDRLYSYERDAPGNFNIPSYYGRGFSCSFNAAWKPHIGKGRLKLYSSAQLKRYSVKGEKKPGTAGLKFQGIYDF